MKLLKRKDNIPPVISVFEAALLFFTILFGFTANSQNFEVNAIPSHELCPGNGTLTLSSENANPASPVIYKVYLLPNTTNAVFNSTGTSVTGLNDGTYLIVATQNINGTITQDNVEVIIEDQTVPLEFTLLPVEAQCGPDGQIIVTDVSGTAVTYEIISGPVLIPPQPGNVLQNLYAGEYVVRVTDNCGTGIVTTQEVGSGTTQIILQDAMFPDAELPGCNLITAAHNFEPVDDELPYQPPFDVTLTVYPPDGSAPQLFTQTVWSLDPGGPDVFQVIPFYYDTPYYYDLHVVDGCGIEYDLNNNLVDQQLRVMADIGDAGCPGKLLIITLSKFVGPYTIHFDSYPTGFDPEVYNALHPGPFTDPVTAYGSEANDLAVPYGEYSVTVTDACGRSESGSVLIEEIEVIPFAATFPATCASGMGGVEINIPGFEMIAATITIAPDEYAGGTPDVVTEFINAEFKLEMLDMLPPGFYTAVVVDECDRSYDVPFTIGTSIFSSISPNARVDCTPGMGTSKIASTNALTKVVITSAPTAFSNVTPLPHDASYNINASGIWYMNNLPPGTYGYFIDDACGTNVPLTQTLNPYATTINEFTLTRHCGSFDLLLNHTTTSSVFVSYWLQKEISPGVWGHPETNMPYTWGEPPTGTDSYAVTNNVEMFSLTFTGNFRIIKRFRTFGTGRADDDIDDEVECIEVLHDNFSFFDDLSLIDIVSLTCTGDIADVQVNAQGAEPINYTIVSKNGQPFTISNGPDNVFTGLESAGYEVYFEDPCGNFITQFFNVADLPSLVTASTPPDLRACDEGGDNVETFDLAAQTPFVIDGQSPANFTVTYHTSLTDADAGVNSLPLSYTSGSATLYARVLNNLNTACHATAFFDVIVRPKPQLNMADLYSICQGESITIYADPGFSSYLWDGIPEGSAITVSEAGTHTIIVTDSYGCSATQTLTVATSAAPQIASIDIADWTDGSNTITVIIEESGAAANFEYSIDGVNYQDSNVFTNLVPGPYTVSVRDSFGCGLDEGEVYLLTYPKFFTPNGDGINDAWRIQFSTMEPNMLLYIYDRYGKLVSSFDAMHEGWDGTYNGRRLPATDYWFVVKRENGKEYKGHFSMLR